MARNAEKAMTTLARWRASQLDAEKGNKRRRPFLASECDDLKEAERWRLEIIREVSKKVTQIQNAGLGEFRIRDLNDQINKLLREKRHWEYRIGELGGSNYRRAPGPRFDSSGREVPGNRGYKYFGAAKDLPGVRELFSQEPPPPPRKTRAELMRDVDADYYGYRDEDDGVILPLEAIAQKEAIAAAIADHKEADPEQIPREPSLIEEMDTNPAKDEEGLEAEAEGIDFAGPRIFVSHVPSVPTQEQVREELVRRRKEELLRKYASESMQRADEEAKDLMGMN